MAADETPLPAIIDIVINPKCSARKKWNTITVRYTHANGLAGLKGMIERQLKEQLPKMQQNGEEAYYYSANLTNPGATREIVQMWTYLDDLQYRPKLTSTQRDFVIITSDEELTTNLTK